MSSSWLPRILGGPTSEREVTKGLLASSKEQEEARRFSVINGTDYDDEDDIVLDFPAPRRPPYTRILLYFAAAAIPLALLLLFLPIDHLLPSSPSFGPSCNSSTIRFDRRDPQFWSVEVAPGAQYATVRPRDHVQYSNCDQLADAWFTVRQKWNATSHVRLLDDAERVAPGVHRFTLVPPLGPQPSDTVSLEATLELAWFTGGKDGMPCPAEACNETALDAQGVHWVGKPILDETTGLLPTYQNALAPLPALTIDTPLCTEFDHLSGYWVNDTLTYTPLDSSGQPCRLQQVPTAIPKVGRRRWIRFIGDSNMRFFFWWAYAPRFGLTCAASTRRLHYACWDKENMFTWSWYFHRQIEEGQPIVLPTSEDQMNVMTKEHFRDVYNGVNFVSSDHWNKTGAWPTEWADFDDTPERMYVSLGSHSSFATILGVRNSMEKMLPYFERIKSSLVLVLTTATAPEKIPDKYALQKTMRHNIMVKERNSAIHDVARGAGLQVFDLFTLTRTTGPEWHNDNVHFHQPIYQEWMRIYFTEWMESQSGDVAAKEVLLTDLMRRSSPSRRTK